MGGRPSHYLGALMRWLLLDEIISIEKGKRAQTRSHVPDVSSYSTEFLMIEMMAKTGALIVGAKKDFAEDLVFAKMESAVFSPGLKPGEPLEIEARAEHLGH